MIIDFLKLALIFVVIDSVYLYSMSNHFNDLIMNIQGSKLKLKTIPTVLCYLFLLSSIYYFLIYKPGVIIGPELLLLSQKKKQLHPCSSVQNTILHDILVKYKKQPPPD